jgi:hypothetical protein
LVEAGGIHGGDMAWAQRPALRIRVSVAGGLGGSLGGSGGDLGLKFPELLGGCAAHKGHEVGDRNPAEPTGALLMVLSEGLEGSLQL